MECLSRFCSSVIEYETPKVVTVHNPTIGLLRRSLQVGVVLYVGLYQLYYAKVGKGVGIGDTRIQQSIVEITIDLKQNRNQRKNG